MHDLAITGTAPAALEQRLIAFEREVIREAQMSDSLDSALERRVAALEEVLAARGPARLLAAHRLGRAIRASIAPFPGPSFLHRRGEAISTEWLASR